MWHYRRFFAKRKHSRQTGHSEAKRFKREINQGRDPMTERDEARESPNVRQLIDLYLEEHASKLAKQNRNNQA